LGLYEVSSPDRHSRASADFEADRCSCEHTRRSDRGHCSELVVTLVGFWCLGEYRERVGSVLLAQTRPACRSAATRCSLLSLRPRCKQWSRSSYRLPHPYRALTPKPTVVQHQGVVRFAPNAAKAPDRSCPAEGTATEATAPHATTLLHFRCTSAHAAKKINPPGPEGPGETLAVRRPQEKRGCQSPLRARS